MADDCDYDEGRSGQPLRPLLPASRETPRGNPVPPTKRPRASGACSSCRDRKYKCSAERPKCRQCLRRNALCEYIDTSKQALNQKYEDLRNRQDAYEEFIDKLIHLRENESLDLLRRIRASNDAAHSPTRSRGLQTESDPSEANATHHNVRKRKNEQFKQSPRKMTDIYGLLQHASERGASELFRHLRQSRSPDNVPALTGQLLSRSPSPNQTNRSIMPPTDTSLEFELVSSHPNAYPSLIPLTVASIDLSLLGISPLRSLRSNRRKSSSSVGRAPMSQTTSPHSSDDYVDSRLARIQMRRWSNIPISNNLAARAISSYLLNDTAWLAHLNIDLFLEDFANGRNTFCSRLLVCSVLAWACQSYSYFEPCTLPFASAFLEEASELYNVEKDIDLLTTVAATALMSITWISIGNDKTGLELLAENADMAQRLGLYNIPKDAPPSSLDLDDKNVAAAAAAAAWGSFNFQMIISMGYRRETLSKSLPNLPIPGEFSGNNLGNGSLPSYHGKTHTSVCKFWAVAFEMNYHYIYTGAVTLPAAALLFHKLLAWADDLQKGVQRGEHVSDAVFILHIWFHSTVIDVFRSFSELIPQPRLTTFADIYATPAKIVEASVKQLKRLIYDYRAAGQSANFSGYYQSGMLYLLNHILHDYKDKEAHFYFLLCIRGYQNLARTTPLARGIVQSVAVMAARQGVTIPEDVLKIIAEIKEEGRQIEHFISRYPVDLAKYNSDSPARTLEYLVGEFRGVASAGPNSTQYPEGWKGNSVALFTTLLEDDEDADETR